MRTVLKESIFFVGNFNENIATMTVCMDKVMFDEHLKEGTSSNSSDKLIHLMGVIFIVRYWFSWDEGHDKDLVSGFRERFRELHIRICKNFIEFLQILSLFPKKYLLGQHLLQGMLVHGNFKCSRKYCQKSTDTKDY